MVINKTNCDRTTMGDLVRLVTPNTYDHDKLPLYVEFDFSKDSPDGYGYNEGFVKAIELKWEHDVARILIKIDKD